MVRMNVLLVDQTLQHMLCSFVASMIGLFSLEKLFNVIDMKLEGWRR